MQEKNEVRGFWKFNSKISTKELGEVAEKWAAEDPNYLQLYVRKVSKDQLGIGFAYRLPEDVDNYNEYFDRTSDQLKRMFGNDLVGWDMASPVWVIK